MISGAKNGVRNHAGRSPLPLPKAKDDESDDSNDQWRQGFRGRPRELAGSQTNAGDHQRQAGCEEEETEQVQSHELLPECEVIVTGVTLGRPVPDDQENDGGSPEGSLKPLEEDRSASIDVFQGQFDGFWVSTRPLSTYKPVTPASMLVSLDKSTHAQRRDHARKCGSGQEGRLCHCKIMVR